VIIFIDGGTWVGGNSFLEKVKKFNVKKQPLKISDCNLGGFDNHD